MLLGSCLVLIAGLWCCFGCFLGVVLVLWLLLVMLGCSCVWFCFACISCYLLFLLFVGDTWCCGCYAVCCFVLTVDWLWCWWLVVINSVVVFDSLDFC